MGELIFRGLSRMSHHLPSFSLSLDFLWDFEITITSVDSYSLRARRELILICHFQDEEMEAENGQARSCGRAGGRGAEHRPFSPPSQYPSLRVCSRLPMYLAYVLVTCFISKNICT